MLFVFFWVILKFCESCCIVSLAVVLKIVLGGCVISDWINTEVCLVLLLFAFNSDLNHLAYWASGPVLFLLFSGFPNIKGNFLFAQICYVCILISATNNLDLLQMRFGECYTVVILNRRRTSNKQVKAKLFSYFFGGVFGRECFFNVGLSLFLGGLHVCSL